MSADVKDQSTNSGDERAETAKPGTKEKSQQESIGGSWKRLVDFSDGYTKVLGAVLVTGSVISGMLFVYAHLFKHGSPPSDIPSPSVTRSTASPQVTATFTSASPHSNPTPGGKPLYQGTVIITKDGVDLDAPPTAGLHGAVVVGKYGTTLNLSGDAVQGMGISGGYEGTTWPQKRACVWALNQSHLSSTQALDVGQYVCVRTAGQYIALLKIENMDEGLGQITVSERLYRP